MQFAVHWHLAICSRGILAIRNILGVQGDGPLCVLAFWELASPGHSAHVRGKHFPRLRRKAKEQ